MQIRSIRNSVNQVSTLFKSYNVSLCSPVTLTASSEYLSAIVEAEVGSSVRSGFGQSSFPPDP